MTRLRCCALVAAMLAGGFAGGWLAAWLADPGPAWAQASPGPAERLAVRQLVLLDEQGRTRGQLGMIQGQPQLIILDEQGPARLVLGLAGPEDNDFWILSVLDANRKTRFKTAAKADGGGSMVGVLDHNGTARFTIGYTDQGTGGLVMNDAQGRRRFTIGMPAHAGYSIHIQDEQGNDLWAAPGQPHPQAAPQTRSEP